MRIVSTERPDVRTALLTAAREELVEHGWAGISLRAVARRAGVSHAAPKHHFGDRRGLLTAIAAEGFDALTASLEEVIADDSTPQSRLAALGRAYVDFGLHNPAMFDLMFRPTELHTDDPTLAEARRRSIGVLNTAVTRLSPSEPTPSGTPELALIAWALAHGLVVLARDGALQSAAGADRDDVTVPLDLIGLFSQRVADDSR
jgi:AcrR family transcriptional regulator